MIKAEAGQFPGVLLQMCYWYRPDEMSLRLLYFCTNTNYHTLEMPKIPMFRELIRL